MQMPQYHKHKQIDRRGFLRMAGLGVVAAAMPRWACGAPGESKKKPNVVLIISDDQGYTDYGFMGHDTVKTPHIDKLASESVVFTRGYVTTALCSPSLATMLTGLYPHQHRITGNDPAGRGRQRRDRTAFYEAFMKCPRLPAMIRKAGYVSFQTGKYWMGHYSRAGFTGGMTVKGRHGEAGLVIGRKTMKPMFDFIDKAKGDGKPFFVWYAPFLPHTPHNPPKRIFEKYASVPNKRTARYYAMCEWFDETCGQLLDHLDKRGLADNTVIVYVCDNGWPFPVKGSPYELGVRTPIMIRWPGKVKPRRDTTTLASSIDLVPTILELCGLKPTSEMPGLNLLDGKALARRDTLFLESFCHDMADVNRPGASLRNRSCIRGDWKLILWQNPMPKVRSHNNTRRSKQDAELYNIKTDPAEKANVADKHPQKVAEMTKLINDWWSPK